MVCRQVIIGAMLPNASALASQKFASNVLETCLHVSSQAQKDDLTRTITLLPAAAEQPEAQSSEAVPVKGENTEARLLADIAQRDPLLRLMQDAYGNYVIGKAAQACPDPSSLTYFKCLALKLYPVHPVWLPTAICCMSAAALYLDPMLI